VVTINVDPAPTADAGNGSTIGSCASSIANISGSATGTGPLNYSWLPTNGLSNPNILNPTAHPVATTTYTLTVTDIYGCTATDIVTITVDPLPTVNAGADQNIGTCANSVANINAIGTGTGTLIYSWTPTNGLNQVNIPNPTAKPSITTTYIITITDIYGCTASDNIVVTVNPMPTANAGTDINIGTCSTSTGTLNGSGTGVNISYTWTPNNGLTNASAASTIAKPSITTTYTLTITDMFGCYATDDIVVNVRPLPTVNAGPDVNIGACATSIANLSGTGTAFGPPLPTYTWSPTNGIGNPTAPNTTAKPTATTTYNLTITDMFGCTAIDNIIVNVNNLVVNAGVDDSLGSCPSSVAILSGTVNGTGPMTYSWTPVNGLNVSNIASPITAHPATTTVYTFTVTDVYNCSASDNITITVDPMPSADAGPDINIGTCINSVANINGTGTGSGPLSFSWTPATGLSDPNIANPVSHPNSTTTYLMTVTDKYGCFVSDSMKVIVNPLPVVDAGLDTNIGYCASSVATLYGSGSGSAPVTYLWSPANGITDIASPVTTAKPNSTTVYTLTITDMFGCTATDNATVNIDMLTSDAGPDAAIGTCLASSTVLNGSATGTGPFTYQWSPPSGLNLTNVSNPTAHPTNTTSYSLVVTDFYGCTATDEMTVSVNIFDESVLHFNINPRKGCQPLLAHFSFNPNNEVVPNSWTWNFGDYGSSSNTSTDQNPAHLYEDLGTFIITLTVNTIYGCPASYSDTVKVKEKPIAAFINIPEVGSTDNPRIEFFDQSVHANTWSWTFGDPHAINHDTSSIKNPVHIFSDSGVYLVTLIVSNSNGCYDTATRYVNIFQEFAFYIPNAFTPNDDGRNDIFKPTGVGYKSENYEMFIFDRWGKKIFSSKDINIGWDGINSSGEAFEQGVYTYMISITQDNGIKRVFKGVVTIIN
jgi:gliding motility-associated-like protein